MIINAIKNLNFNQINFISKQNKVSGGLRLSTLSEDRFEKSISFKGFPCPPDRFKLKELEEIPCPSCGKPMLQSTEIRRFVDKISTQTGEDLISTLQEYTDLYRPIEAQAVKEIIDMAEKFPDDDLSALVKYAGVKHSSNLVKEQVRILKRIEGLGGNLKKDEKIKLSECVRSAIKFAKMTGNKDGDHFGRKQFIGDLYELTEGFSNEKIVRDIRKTALDLPSSTSSLSAFFVKYSRENVEKIATRFLSPMTATTEHIKPISLGGEDDTANYLVECTDCNSKRGNMPYEEWFKIMPQMPQNLQTYLDTMDKIIKTYNLKGYENYVKDIAETIEQETNGKLVLKAPGEIDDLNNTSKDTAQIRKQKIERASQLIEENQRQLQELDKKFKEIEYDEEFQSVLMYFNLYQKEEYTRLEKIGASKKLTAARHEWQIQENRKEKVAQAKKELEYQQENNGQKKEIDTLKERISKISEKIKQKEDVEDVLTEAQQEYEKAYREHTKAEQELKTFLKTFKLPEDYILEENEIQTKIKERKEIEKEKKRIDAMLQEKRGLSAQIGTLKNDIEALREENDIRKEGIDFNSRDTQEKARQYRELRKQLGILSSDELQVTMQTIKNYCNRNRVSLDFVKQKARERVEMEIEELRKTEIGEYLYVEDEISALEEEIMVNEDSIENMPKFSARKRSLTLRLNQLNQDKTVDELERELEEVKAKRQSLQEKFKYADIKTERDGILRRIGELTELLQKLLKQEEQ